VKNIKLLFKFLEGNRLVYFGAVAAICFSTFFTAAVPITISSIIDSIIGDKPMNLPSWIMRYINQIGGRSALLKYLFAVCMILVLITLGQGLFYYLKGKLSAVASENSAKNIREKVYNHLQHVPYDYHVKTQAGDLIQRCTSDIDTIRGFVASQMVDIAQIIISFTYVFLMMLSMNTRYTLISVMLVPVIFVFTIIFFINMKKTFKLTDEAEGSMSSTLQENLTGTRVVRAFGAQSFEIQKFDEKSMAYRDYIKKIILLMSNFWSNSNLMCMLQYEIVLVTGIYLMISGGITIGTFVAFSSLAGMLIWPIRQLGQNLAFMGQAFISLNRIQEILDAKVELSEPNEHEPQISGDIEFDNVYFEYEKDKPVLNDISFRIKRGQTIAVLGSTGSGKSSLVHLLLRLYDYQCGSIKLDGIELKDIKKKWLRENIGIVLQEPFLFSKTIGNNIKMGKSDAPEQEVHSASSIASIHDTILGFEKGYDTLIGERGVTLSGGQRQRLAIARTVIRDVPILIFDDSLSAVDMETDAAIRAALKERSRNTTTIIISHRITTLAEADLIFVLDGGKVKQSGTHEELINQDGLYRRVWLIQNSLEEELAQIV